MQHSTITNTTLSLSVRSKLPPFYFIVTFWGERYRDWFCRFPLASLLSPNNIPALKNKDESRFLICTTHDDWEALQDEPNFRLLTSHIEPVFLELPLMPSTTHKYNRMSLGHEMLTQRCFEAGAVAIYTCPDTLIPDGCVAEAQCLVEEGARVVLCTAIRFELDGIEQELKRRGLLESGKPITISRREAVAIGLHNLHSESQAGEWDVPYFGELNQAHGRNHFPTCCFWRVPSEEGIYIVTHNWAPFVINYSGMDDHNVETFKHWAIDGDYIHKNFGDLRIGQEIRVIEDSDNIVLIGMTPRDEMAIKPRHHWWQSLPIVGEWSKGFILNQAVFDYYTDSLRRSIYSKGVRWHTGDLSAKWEPVERRAQAIIAEYMVHDLRPLHMLVGLRSFRTSVRVLRSVGMVRMLWLSYIFSFHAWLAPSTGVPLIAYMQPARIASYIRVIVRAACGDREELARIKRRLKITNIRSTHRYSAPLLIYYMGRGKAYIVTYPRVVIRALLGDRIESERIGRRMKIIAQALTGRFKI
jgi:hypothetical protein